MHVCFLTHSDSPWAPYYTRFFQERGHRVDLISFHPEPIEGVNVHYVGAKASGARLPKWIYLLRVPRVRRLLRELRPEVVLATYVRSNGLVGALSKCSALVVSTVGADHDWGLPGPLNSQIARWIGRRAELLHSASQELVDSMAAAGVPPEKFTVIPFGVDAQEFTPREGPRAPGRPRILCTRKHYDLYDNDTIVRALAFLRDRGLDFEARFAAKGPTLERTRQLVRDLGLDNDVVFIGDVEHAEVPSLLRWADIYVSAAKSDGAAASLVEAMSCMHFPLVTDVRANRDWLVHRETGYLCQVGNPEDFAAGIEYVCSHPEQVARGGQINRKTIIERCDRDTGLSKLERLLDEAIDIHRGTGTAGRSPGY
jgi:glycosyltransferase involved in cell wall biosynthesis